MKKQVRNGVFETNSSSCHAICIAKNQTLQYPDHITFRYGDFGWKYRRIDTIKQKASYLYTCLSYVFESEGISKWKEYVEFIFNTLKSKNIKVSFEGELTVEPKVYDDDLYFHEGLDEDEGYVDHVNEAMEFVDAVCTDENRLLSYLFSPNSFVMTGNDNDEGCVPVINEDYDHEKFYKGN